MQGFLLVRLHFVNIHHQSDHDDAGPLRDVKLTSLFFEVISNGALCLQGLLIDLVGVLWCELKLLRVNYRRLAGRSRCFVCCVAVEEFSGHVGQVLGWQAVQDLLCPPFDHDLKRRLRILPQLIRILPLFGTVFISRHVAGLQAVDKAISLVIELLFVN